MGKKSTNPIGEPYNTIKLENHLEAKTQGHKDYIRSIIENDITICIGPPGCGKTFISVGIGCEMLSRGQIEKLIFSRPIIQCGKDIGTLPGDLKTKTEIFFYPILDCLDYFLGKNKYKSLMQSGKIDFIPLELMRGMSIKDTFLVLDEASNADYGQLKMLLSRIDYGSKFILNGDPKQCDLKYCGFSEVAEKLEKSKISSIGFCELTRDDIQRPKFISSIMSCLEN